MLNFVVCDDNLNIASKLSQMLEALFIKHNLSAQILLKTSSPEDVLEYISSADVFLLDINLHDKISGLQIAEKIRLTNKNAYIIFTTGHLEYVMMAYKFKTFDYLAKPITLDRLEETVIRLFNDIYSNPTHYIKIDNKYTLMNPKNINYIEKEGMKIVFHTINTEYTTYNSFKKIQDCLPENFIRCHKSYIVNINNINNIECNNKINFDNKEYCFIGPKYKNNLLEVLNHGNYTTNLDFTNNTK
ncbi:MAG: response regulator transcription factor [Clostridia bacterium]|nr:response regulator transcription factor [Clostridia bacterium]